MDRVTLMIPAVVPSRICATGYLLGTVLQLFFVFVLIFVFGRNDGWIV